MKKLIRTSLVIVFVIIAAFLVYAYSPLFYDREVNEDFPAVSTSESGVQATSVQEEVRESVESEPTVEDVPSAVVEEEAKAIDPALLYSGQFVNGERSYQVSGDAFIFELEDGSRVLRLEDFSSTNGPDLKVYFATSTDASDFVSLGELKGNVGNQNYELPDSLDIGKYNTVLIWCESFSRHFGNAVLS